MSDIAPTESPMTRLGKALGAGGVQPALTQRELARALGFALLDTMKNDSRYVEPLTLTVGDQPAETQPLHIWLSRMLDLTWPEKDSPEQQGKFNQLAATLLAVKDPQVQHHCIRYLTRLGHMYQLAGLLARDSLLQQHTGASTARSFLDGKLGSKKGVVYKTAEQAVAALNRPALEMTFTAHPTNSSSIDSMKAQRELGTLLSRWKNDDGREGPELMPQIRKALQAYGDTPILPMKNAKEWRKLSNYEEADYMLNYLSNSYTDLPNLYASYDKALGEKFKDSYRPETLKLGVKFHSWGSSGDKDGNKEVTADSTLYALAAHHAEILERYQSELTEALHDLPAMNDWGRQIDTACVIARHVQKTVRLKLAKPSHLSETEFDALSTELKNAMAPLDARAFENDLDAAYKTASESQKPALLALLRKVHTFGFSFGKIEYRETAPEFERIASALIPGYKDMKEPARQQAIDGLLKDPAQAAALVERFRQLGEGAVGKPYSDDDVAPIAYQTRKRMELARDFPNAIQNQVLAECQTSSNMLEALLLQHAVADTQGTRPMLGVVPLFEDGERLKASSTIVKTALDTESYQAHLAAVSMAHREPAIQQVQLAHSDNARRNGMPAARGLIYQAHQDLRAMIKNIHPGVTLQFYEGGSQSDPYRGGARAISATVNEFGLHDFTKMTFQGGDLLNYLNQPMSIFRLLMRNLTNSAAKLEQPEPLRRKVNPEQEVRIVTALDNAKEHYVKFFEGEAINDLMEKLGFNEEAAAGNVSTRAKSRNNGTKVDVKEVRSIGYSMVFAHSGIVPTWLGTMNLRQTLSEQFKGRTENPKELNRLYVESPVMRDNLDRILWGVVRSDLDYFDKLSGHHATVPELRAEYAAAFKLCYEAMEKKKAPEGKTCAEMRQILIDDICPHMKDVFADQDRFLQLGRGIKRAWVPDQNGTSDRDLERRLAHNALNTVYHGNIPLVNDTTYARLYCDKLGIERPYAPKSAGQGAGHSHP